MVITNTRRGINVHSVDRSGTQILPRNLSPLRAGLASFLPSIEESTRSRRVDAGHGPGNVQRYNEPMPGSDPMNPATAGMKLTYDDFVHFPNDGKRHELIDGEHYVTPSPAIRHQSIVGAVFFLVATYLEQHPIGRVFLSPLDVVMSDNDVVEPDLLYVSNERADTLAGIHVRGAPDLVIEVASKGTRKRDATIKRRLYERAGVTEYWIVDPETEAVRVYRREVEGFGRAIELLREADEMLTTPLLPGLDLPLSRIFRE
jgi:Uma2 family endonuclease